MDVYGNIHTLKLFSSHRERVQKLNIVWILMGEGRLHLSISGWIYEVASPRYALRCFATPVEARSPP